MLDLFWRDRRSQPYPYMQNIVFCKETRRLDWRIEFALLILKAVTVAAIVIVAGLVALLPDANLRSLLGGRQSRQPTPSRLVSIDK